MQIPPTSEELRETLRDSGTLAGKGWQPPLQIRTSSSQPSLSAARQFGILKPVQNAFHDLPLLPPKSPRRRTSSQSSQQELPSSSPALGSLIGSFPSPMRRKRTSLDKKSLPATPSSQQRSSHASSTRFNTAKDLPSRGLRRLTLTPAAAPTPAPSPAHHNKSQSLGILPSSAAQLAASLDIPRDALQPMLDASHAVWRTHAQEGGKSSRQRLRSTSQPREVSC